MLAAVPANGAGILDAPCAPLGSKYILSDYKNAPPTRSARGHDMAAFVRGKNAPTMQTSDYMMLVWSMDSGKGDGGISFWNWSQPDVWSAPTRAFRLAAPQLREAHTTPVTNMFANDWRTWVLQATTGFSIYNLDSIAAPLLVTTVAVPDAAKYRLQWWRRLVLGPRCPLPLCCAGGPRPQDLPLHQCRRCQQDRPGARAIRRASSDTGSIRYGCAAIASWWRPYRRTTASRLPTSATPQSRGQ